MPGPVLSGKWPADNTVKQQFPMLFGTRSYSDRRYGLGLGLELGVRVSIALVGIAPVGIAFVGIGICTHAIQWAGIGNLPQSAPIYYTVPWALASPPAKRQVDRVNRLHGSRFMTPILYYEPATSSSQNRPFLSGDPYPHLIHGYMGQPNFTAQTAFQSVQPFFSSIGLIHDRFQQTHTQADRHITQTDHATTVSQPRRSRNYAVRI